MDMENHRLFLGLLALAAAYQLCSCEAALDSQGESASRFSRDFGPQAFNPPINQFLPYTNNQDGHRLLTVPERDLMTKQNRPQHFTHKPNKKTFQFDQSQLQPLPEGPDSEEHNVYKSAWKRVFQAFLNQVRKNGLTVSSGPYTFDRAPEELILSIENSAADT